MLSVVMLSVKNVSVSYCKQGTEMRQLVLGPQTFIVRLLIIFTCATSSFHTRTKKGEKGLAPRETEKESV
jgi:hypothetical protein